MSELSVTGLSKEFPTRAEPLSVLRDVSLNMRSPDSLAILGPSGSGKSTLLHIIGTLDTPTHGRVTLDGMDPFALDETGLAQFRNAQIGFVFQDHHLLPQLTVLENVLVPVVAQHGTTHEEAERARQLLDRVGLGDRLDHRPAELSGGERQRTAIARALIMRPRLLLADEPTGNLDQRTAESIGQLLVSSVQTADHDTILIVVTHSRELAELFSRRCELRDGQLCELKATTQSWPSPSAD